MMVPPSREESRRESIRRIQIGAAGLGGVLMLVGLTNVLVDNIRKDGGLSGGTDVMGGLVATNSAEAVAKPPTEPLADLGVTPTADAGTQQAAPAVPDLEPDPQLQKPMDRDPRQAQ
ncbi:hypothetical protein LWE61_04740 [Sphingobium sufflavum]|uniref:hypothetical protein n=1 Tax=Sphingobium sufflavum TaxID=1129547 RepID=UPI001F1C596B|nr:hypothetical protein [Sphingobium sufflavum]MCE7795865.1 hypothetical protein [Sphingobium sufflavum]